jgi:drug/metabolite transporter (DMT)-like permease
MIKVQGQQKGLMLAFLAASSLAFITTFARLMYDARSKPLTLITLRGGLGLIMMCIVARLVFGQIALPRAAWRVTAMCCVGLVMISFGYMMSVAYIPLVILAYEAIKARKMPGPKRLATFLFAFAGLGLALGPSFETLIPLGSR